MEKNKCRFRSEFQHLTEKGVVDFLPEVWIGVGQAFCALKSLFKKESGYPTNFCYDENPSKCSIFCEFSPRAEIKIKKKCFIASRK